MPKEIDTDRIPAAAFDKIKEKMANRADPIDNSKLIADFRTAGGQVFHCRPRFGDDRGVTVALKIKGRRAEIATAVQHGADSFTKKIGTKLAVERFNEGRTVHFPIIGDATDFVREMRFAVRNFQ